MNDNPFLEQTNPFLPDEKENTVSGIAGSVATGLARGVAGLGDLPTDLINLAGRGSKFITEETADLLGFDDFADNMRAQDPALSVPSGGFRRGVDANTGENQFFLKPETTAEQFIANTAEIGVAFAATGPIGGTRTAVAKQSAKFAATEIKALRQAEKIGMTPQLRDAVGRFMTKAESAKIVAGTKGTVGKLVEKIFGTIGGRAQEGIARRIEAAARVATVPSFTARFAAEKFNRAGGSVITGPIDKAATKIFSKLGAPGRLADEAYQSFGGAGYVGYDFFVSAITGVPMPGIQAAIYGKATSKLLDKAAKIIRNPDATIKSVRNSKYFDALIAAKEAGKATFKTAVILFAIEPEFQDLIVGSDLGAQLRDTVIPNENPFLR